MNNQKLKFAVVGAGGVGGYFGGRLAQAGIAVRLIARGAHLEALRRSGLAVHCPDGDFTVPSANVAGSPEQAGPADVVLFCVKSYDTGTAAASLAPLLTRNTIIISLQNGVENEEAIRTRVPAGVVFGGVAYIYATMTAPGHITESGGPRKIVFGPLSPPDARVQARAVSILDAFTEAGISAELTGDIMSALWKKFVFIAAVGGVTALTRLTLGQILAVSETRALLADAMREAAAVARTRGAAIEEGFLDDTFERLKQFDNNTRSSLYHDLTHDRPLELDALSGTVVRYGKKAGVPTPVHSVIYASLLPYHLTRTMTTTEQDQP